MKNECTACCPGCKRRCCAGKPACKYGKKYFSDIQAKKKTGKWSQYAEEGGLAWQLLDAAHMLKKCLKKQKRSEADIFGPFPAEEQKKLYDTMVLLKKQLEYS